MESGLDHHSARALLEWQIEMGADEAISDAPINRYDLAAVAKPVRPDPVAEAEASDAASIPTVDPVAVATRIAAAAGDLAALQTAIADFDLCDLKRGAKTTVFSDGNASARVMIIGEAPGRDEDIQGKPFVGRAGQLLDRMLASISLDRAAPDAEKSVYITNVLPWRPPQNRDPTPDEIGMMMPFLNRHVALAAPDVIVLMGNISCQAILGRRGITRLRGNWTTVLDVPALPMFHPAYLLRNPIAKREAWHDLLMLQARLRE